MKPTSLRLTARDLDRVGAVRADMMALWGLARPPSMSQVVRHALRVAAAIARRRARAGGAVKEGGGDDAGA